MVEGQFINRTIWRIKGDTGCTYTIACQRSKVVNLTRLNSEYFSIVNIPLLGWIDRPLFRCYQFIWLKHFTAGCLHNKYWSLWIWCGLILHVVIAMAFTYWGGACISSYCSSVKILILEICRDMKRPVGLFWVSDVQFCLSRGGQQNHSLLWLVGCRVGQKGLQKTYRG